MISVKPKLPKARSAAEQSARDFFREFKKRVLTGFQNWLWISATEADLDRVSKETVQENLQRLEKFLLKQAKRERDGK